MKLYDNDSHRDAFTELVYDLLNDDPTWDRANQIIESFDSAPAVEVSDAALGGAKELAHRPQGGPCDATIELMKPVEGDAHTYLKPCRICGNTEVIYEKYQHDAGPRWRCWCTKCLACIDPGWAQSQSAVRAIWNQEPPNDPLTPKELCQMLGESVWIEANWENGSWAILCWINAEAVGAYKYGLPEYAKPDPYREGMIRCYPVDGCGKTWRAYRRKPEGGCQT